MSKSFFYTAIYFFSIFFYFEDELKIIKYVCVVSLLMFNIAQHIYFEKRFRRLNIAILLFALVVMASAILSQRELGNYKWHLGIGPSILLVLQTFGCFGYVEYVILSKTRKEFLHDFMKCLGTCLLITDIYLILVFDSLQGFTTTYFIGNKFIISYYHILLFAVLGTLYKLDMLTNILLLLLCLSVSIIVQCSTGIIGSITFFVLYAGRKLIKYLYRPSFLFGSILLSACFAVFVDIIVNTPLFVSMLELLDEDPSLTGRTAIYAKLFDIISERPVWGYGTANNSSYVVYYTTIGNAQNGLLADVVDWGVIGTLFFLFLIYLVILECHNKKRGYNIMCFLWMYIVASTVEITMDGKFLVALSLLLAMSYKSLNPLPLLIKSSIKKHLPFS